MRDVCAAAPGSTPSLASWIEVRSMEMAPEGLLLRVLYEVGFRLLTSRWELATCGQPEIPWMGRKPCHTCNLLTLLLIDD